LADRYEPRSIFRIQNVGNALDDLLQIHAFSIPGHTILQGFAYVWVGAYRLDELLISLGPGEPQVLQDFIGQE